MGRKQTLMTAKKAKVPTAVALRKGGCYGYPSQTGSDAPAAKRMRLTVNLEDAARTGTSGNQVSRGEGDRWSARCRLT